MSYRFAALCVAAFATQAFAEDSSVGREVRLECPSGTVQKGGRVTKEIGVYCVKVGSTPQRPALHGPYVDFWANGQKQSEGQYKDGFRSGRWTYYDMNGVKTGETQFEQNDYHGARVEYHPNGAKKLEQTWVKGKREGVETSYSTEGQKVSEVRYAADKPLAAQ